MELARQHYGCDDIQGVYLENEGGSGTARLGVMFLHDRGGINIFLLALIGKKELFTMN